MAYQLHYWADDNGKGQIELRCTRLKSVEEVFPLTLEHNRPSGTVLITMDRTDRQSIVEQVIWTKEGYVDPCNEVK